MIDGPAGRERPGVPRVPLRALDTIWFQVGGTICNLRCTHCFISCSPDNHSHAMMSLEQVRVHLEDAVRLGVREYYFTGGEPFMNRDLMRILEETLRCGPVSVLTNGLFLDEKRCRRLRRIADGSEYSLEIRISLDGWGPEDHDAVRGAGTFKRTVAGIRRLWKAGLNPIITVTEAAKDVGSGQGRALFLDRLRGFGLTKPRLKILPLWRIGAERERSRGYAEWERLTPDMVKDESLAALQCSTGRMVTSRGVYVCPILIESEQARLGERIGDSLRPFDLSHPACYTCHVSGMTCST